LAKNYEKSPFITMIKFILLFILCGLNFLGYSQSPVFENFSTSDGLPSTQVYDIYQDKNGYMWFATDRGISKYNGYDFESFQLEDGITCNTVFKFFPQKNGNIWCSTYNNKLFYFNTTDYTFIPYQYNDTLVKYASNYVIDDLVIHPDKTIHLSYIRIPGVFSIDSTGNPFKKLYKKNESIAKTLVIEKTKNNQYLGYLIPTVDTLIPQTTEGEIIASKRIKNPTYSNIFQLDSFSIFSDVKTTYIKKKKETIKTIECPSQPLNIGKYDDNHFWVGYMEGGLCVYDWGGGFSPSLLSKTIRYLCFSRP